MMTDEEMRVKIAEACGWKPVFHGIELYAFQRKAEFIYKHQLPDYPQDLNACHEMEKTVIFKHVKLYMRYLRELTRIVGGILDAICATARQRCEAFLAVHS